MDHDALIAGVTRVIELVGVAVLVLGGAIASGRFALDWYRRGVDDAYHRFRANLGRAILLGLEVLIVADIISTVAVEPTLENVGVLAIIVVVRTFLSFALEIEIGGRLPWRREADGGPHRAGD
jgi:uncharacterized membrane protein